MLVKKKYSMMRVGKRYLPSDRWVVISAIAFLKGSRHLRYCEHKNYTIVQLICGPDGLSEAFRLIQAKKKVEFHGQAAVALLGV